MVTSFQLVTAQLMSSRCVLLAVSLAWDLGPFAARPQCLHLDTGLLQQQNTKELWDSKEPRACAAGANSGPKRYKETKKHNGHF